jgi:hypothetical protein
MSRDDREPKADLPVDDAAQSALAEDVADRETLAARVDEPSLPFEAFVGDLRRRGRI